MKIALRAMSHPDRDWGAVAARVRELGCNGVEIRQPPADVGSIRSAFNAAGVEVACLDTGAGMTGRPREDADRAAAVRSLLDAAQQLDCRRVCVPDLPLGRGLSRSAAQVALGDWLLPLGDYAAGRGVTVVVENAISFRTAGDLWTVLDRIDHPAVAACWDVRHAAEAGESPLLSVPVLNSRIQYARVRDARYGLGDATECPPGEGDVAVRAFVTRVRGIGYNGYLAVDESQASAEVVARLKGWASKTGEPAKPPKPAAVG